MSKLKSLTIVFATKDQFFSEIEKVVDGNKKHQDEMTFSSTQTFNKVLTTNRLEIIKAIARQKPRSINQLAKILRREQPHVHKDCKYLELMGFITLHKNQGAKKQYTPKLSFEYDIIRVKNENGEDDFFPITMASNQVLLDAMAS